MDLEVEDLGEQRLRGLPKPMHLYRIRTGFEKPRKDEPSAAAPHRLAAVLHGDAVSFSHHMAVEEDWTIDSVRLARRMAQRNVELHGGRLVDTAGDSMLAEFPSALDATRCAFALQRDLAEHARAAGDENPLRYRLGIHLGDIREEAGSTGRPSLRPRGPARRVPTGDLLGPGEFARYPDDLRAAGLP